MSRFVLGLDSSTQSLTALLIDIEKREVAGEESLNFDASLPSYGTESGVLPNEDPNVVHSPPTLWADALDQLLATLVEKKWPLDQVSTIAGSGQQHGTVYFKASAANTLSQLDSSKGLAEQLRDHFSRSTSPVWLDSSTAEDCAALTEAIGGHQPMHRCTGSSAYERFSGPQIRRFARTEPQAYSETAHILLVSSYMASLLAGKIVGTDHGDASGMNLMDLSSKSWNSDLLQASAPELEGRLGSPIPSTTIVGSISSYFVERYGFSAQTEVMAWSGDNPNSQVGLGLTQDGDCALSMGTSDVLFATLKSLPQTAGDEGHLFYTPTGDIMSLLCFSNGSLAREKVRDQFDLDWTSFDEAIDGTPVGNDGGLMLPWFLPEIVPKVLDAGVIRSGFDIDDVGANCRAVVEGQMLSRRLHAANLGINPRRLRVTGGASRNERITRIAADVFACPVEEIDISASAALGAALRALHHRVGGAIEEVVSPFVEISKVTDPDPSNVATYRNSLEAFARLESEHL